MQTAARTGSGNSSAKQLERWRAIETDLEEIRQKVRRANREDPALAENMLLQLQSKMSNANTQCDYISEEGQRAKENGYG